MLYSMVPQPCQYSMCELGGSFVKGLHVMLVCDWKFAVIMPALTLVHIPVQ